MKILMLYLTTTVFAITLYGESRTWTSRNGSTIEATLVKEEAGVVTLQRGDSSTFQVKLNALSDADIGFVKNQTTPATTVTVTLCRDNRGQWQLQRSSNATERDKVIFQLNTAAAEQPPVLRGDSSWQVDSVNSLGKQIKGHTVDGTTPPIDLITDGKFIFVTFSVKNDAHLPITIPYPRLIDYKGRSFSQTSKYNAHFYIPKELSIPEKDILQPGFEKQFCAFFEIPLDTHPAALEVFPAVLSDQLKRDYANWTVDKAPQGKRIALGEFSEAVSRGLPEASRLISDASSEDKTAENDEAVIGTLFMSCKRASTSSLSPDRRYSGSHNKILSYNVNLRLGPGEPLNIVLRGFFIGDSGRRRETVVDLQEINIELQPGRSATATITSKPIPGYNYNNLKGVIIQAWSGTTIVSSWASYAQWRHLTNSANIIKEIGYYGDRSWTAPAAQGNQWR